MHKPVSKFFITYFAFLLAVPAVAEDQSLPRIVEMNMKKLVFLIVIAALAYGSFQDRGIYLPGLSSWSRSAEAHFRTHTTTGKVISS